MGQSLAERYRSHRLIFEAALRMGVTPAEAKARLRWQQAERKLASQRPAPVVEPERVEPWYRRGDMA